MAETTLLLNGFNIIGDARTNSNASNGGEFMIHDGQAVFEANDIIVLHVSNANPDGSLNNNSIVTGITVYEHATDYYYGVPKFTYTATGGVGDIDVGRRSMGDRYLEFDADGLTSSDAGAPALGELSIVAGMDILAELEATNGPIEVPTNESLDLNGDGTITGDEAGDGIFSSNVNAMTVLCFVRGTLIETPDGPRYIETLREGDLVNTLDNGAQPLRWIGARRCDGRGKNAPIRIRAGALGNIRDLWVSPNHRMLVSGAHAELLFGHGEVLVAAKHLTNDATIRQVAKPEVEYYHFMFDTHQIVFAEGCPSESLFPGQQSLQTVTDAARAEIIELFPELAHADCIGDLSRYELRRFEAEALRLIA